MVKAMAMIIILPSCNFFIFKQDCVINSLFSKVYLPSRGHDLPEVRISAEYIFSTGNSSDRKRSTSLLPFFKVRAK